MQNVAEQPKTNKRDKNAKLLTVGEAAKLLGVHPDTIRRWDKAEKISGIRQITTVYSSGPSLN